MRLHSCIFWLLITGCVHSSAVRTFASHRATDTSLLRFLWQNETRGPKQRDYGDGMPRVGASFLNTVMSKYMATFIAEAEQAERPVFLQDSINAVRLDGESQADTLSLPYAAQPWHDRIAGMLELKRAVDSTLRLQPFKHTNVADDVDPSWSFYSNNLQTRRAYCAEMLKLSTGYSDMSACVSAPFPMYTPGRVNALTADRAQQDCVIIGEYSGMFQCADKNRAVILGNVDGIGLLALRMPARCRSYGSVGVNVSQPRFHFAQRLQSLITSMPVLHSAVSPQDADHVDARQSAPGWDLGNRRPVGQLQQQNSDSPTPLKKDRITSDYQAGDITSMAPCFAVGEMIFIAGFSHPESRGLFQVSHVQAVVAPHPSDIKVDTDMLTLAFNTTGDEIFVLQLTELPPSSYLLANGRPSWTAYENNTAGATISKLYGVESLPSNPALPVLIRPYTWNATASHGSPPTVDSVEVTADSRLFPGGLPRLSEIVHLKGFIWPGNNGFFEVHNLSILQDTNNGGTCILRLKAPGHCLLGRTDLLQPEIVLPSSFIGIHLGVHCPGQAPHVRRVFNTTLALLGSTDIAASKGPEASKVGLLAIANLRAVVPAMCSIFSAELISWTSAGNTGVFSVINVWGSLLILKTTQIPFLQHDGACVTDGVGQANELDVAEYARGTSLGLQLNAIKASVIIPVAPLESSYAAVRLDVLRNDGSRSRTFDVLVNGQHAWTAAIDESLMLFAVPRTSTLDVAVITDTNSTTVFAAKLRTTNESSSQVRPFFPPLTDPELSLAAAEQERIAVRWASCGVNNACSGHGECVKKYDNQICKCFPGWIGIHCDGMFLPCHRAGCGENGVCDPLRGMCICNGGWSGVNCEDRVAEQFEVCRAKCIFGACTTNGTCACASGWTGPTCTVTLCGPGLTLLLDGSCAANAIPDATSSGRQHARACVADGSAADTCNRRASACSDDGRCICKLPYSGSHCQLTTITSGELTRKTERAQRWQPSPSIRIDELAALLIYAHAQDIDTVSISQSQLWTVFQSSSTTEEAKQLADRVMQAADLNEDGQLNANELIFAMRALAGDDIQAYAWRSAFSRLDVNGDGLISVEDVFQEHLRQAVLGGDDGTLGSTSSGLRTRVALPLFGEYTVQDGSLIRSCPTCIAQIAVGDALIVTSMAAQIRAVSRDTVSLAQNIGWPPGRYQVQIIKPEMPLMPISVGAVSVVLTHHPREPYWGANMLELVGGVLAVGQQFVVGGGDIDPPGSPCTLGLIPSLHTVIAVDLAKVTFSPDLTLPAGCVRAFSGSANVTVRIIDAWLSEYGRTVPNIFSSFPLVGILDSTGYLLSFAFPVEHFLRKAERVVLVGMDSPGSVIRVDARRSEFEIDRPLQLKSNGSPWKFMKLQAYVPCLEPFTFDKVFVSVIPGSHLALASVAICRHTLSEGLHPLDVVWIDMHAYVVDACADNRITLMSPFSGSLRSAHDMLRVVSCPSDLRHMPDCKLFSRGVLEVPKALTRVADNSSLWISGFHAKARADASMGKITFAPPGAAQTLHTCRGASTGSSGVAALRITCDAACRACYADGKAGQSNDTVVLSALPQLLAEIPAALQLYIQSGSPPLLNPPGWTRLLVDAAALVRSAGYPGSDEKAISLAGFKRMVTQQPATLVPLGIFSGDYVGRRLLASNRMPSSAEFCAVFSDAKGAYTGLRLCRTEGSDPQIGTSTYTASTEAASGKKRSVPITGIGHNAGLSADRQMLTPNPGSQDGGGQRGGKGKLRRRRRSAHDDTTSISESRNAFGNGQGGPDDGGGPGAGSGGGDGTLTAELDFFDPFFWCDMTNPFGFIFCPTPIPQVNILIKMMIPGMIRPVIDMVLQKFMGGQSAMLTIVDTLVPADDRRFSGLIDDVLLPKPPQPPAPYSSADALNAVLLQLQGLSSSGTVEQTAHASGQSGYATVTSAGVLVPALKQGLADALTQQIVDGVGPILVHDMQAVLHEYLLDSLTFSSKDVLEEVVAQSLVDSLADAVPAMVSDALGHAIAAQVAIPLTESVILALTRQLTSDVASTTVQGVLTGLLDRSSVVGACNTCKQRGIDCHTCKFAEQWLASRIEEANALVLQYGDFYGEKFALDYMRKLR